MEWCVADWPGREWEAEAWGAESSGKDRRGPAWIDRAWMGMDLKPKEGTSMKTKTGSNGSGATVMTPVSNDGAPQIEGGFPYVINVRIRGVADILFHRWSVEGVEEKVKAAKGSKAKREDDIESYVYRCDNGDLGLPGEYLRMPIIGAAKFKQDPRSPRKSAKDLYQAGIVVLTPIASLGTKAWDYVDRRRVMIQRNGVNRSRPALKAGWEAEFEVMVNIPEYIDPQTLLSVANDAGRLIGTGDFRPTYGRFQVVKFERQP